MSPQNLRTWLTLLATVPLTSVAVGCATEVCETQWRTLERVVPPPSKTCPPIASDDGDVPHERDAGKPADAGFDANDAAGGGDAGSDASTNAPNDAGGDDGSVVIDFPSARDTEACVAVDGGTLEEWLALPCETACERLFPGYEILHCKTDPPSGNSSAHTRCDVRRYSCREPRFMMGRPPHDFVPVTRIRGDRASYFEHLAEIEAASVPAFLELARDLERLGFPREDVALARQSARDERRHARAMRRLAARASGQRMMRDASARAAVPAPRSAMSLQTLARANATEGCVGELFAAAIATWIAESAVDEVEKRVFQRIAEEETAHAAFALRLHDALVSRLDAHQREEVAQAKLEAERTLSAGLAGCPSLTALGLVPSVARQRALFDGLFGGHA